MGKRLAPPSTVAILCKRIVLTVLVVGGIGLGVGLWVHLRPQGNLLRETPVIEEALTVQEPITPVTMDLTAYKSTLYPEEVTLPFVTPTPVPQASADYQSFHPEMCCEYPAEFAPIDQGCVYFTFDDGPSAVTDSILNTLAVKEATATFFVMGNTLSDPYNQARLKRMVLEGHTIGIHTQTHDYYTVYASVGAYLADFYAVWDTVYKITGVKGTIFRLPGGSINDYNRGIYKEILAEMTRRGFVYYDWNVSAEDAVSTPATVDSVVANATRHGWRKQPVVLMHDSMYKGVTAQALGEVIDAYIADGYTPKALTSTVRPMQF